MSQFYFHVIDVEGAHLRDASEAKQMAIRSAREILAEANRCGKDKMPDALVIADEEGRAIETIPFASVLPDTLKRVGRGPG
jgi:hypothetical protein